MSFLPDRVAGHADRWLAADRTDSILSDLFGHTRSWHTSTASETDRLFIKHG